MNETFLSLFGTEALTRCRYAFARAKELCGEPTPFPGGFARLTCRHEETGAIVPVYLDHLLASTEAVTPILSVLMPHGEWRPLVATYGDDVLLFFDAAQFIEDLTQERYLPPARPMSDLLPFHYHRLPAALRRQVHRGLVRWRRRRFHEVEQGAWPHWDIQSLWRILFAALGLPYPDGSPEKIFVFSHDVDNAAQLAFAERLARWEVDHGVRACFFLPAVVMRREASRVQALSDMGHEIGMHGLRHDNRQTRIAPQDYATEMRTYWNELQRFKVRGYRGPSLLSSSSLKKALFTLFAYDSSIPDTDVYGEGGKHRGCGFGRPFIVEKMRVLPVTLPLDDRLFTLGESDYFGIWRAKSNWLLARNDVPVLCTHACAEYYPHGFERVFTPLLKYVLEEAKAKIVLPQAAAEINASNG
ncbi:MAG TPA: hypothetical protein PKW95_03945 [bacterium]|nr:hypothetical protein [bacterium]